jgi:hypothetical protein
MCLSKLDGSFKPCDIGYQVKRKAANGFTALYYPGLRNPVSSWDSKVKTRTVLKIGETYRAVPIRTGNRNHRYTAGFHVFHTLHSAKNYSKSHYNCSVVKVKTGGKRTTGRQGRRMVTVATEITLLEEVR